MLDFTLTHVSVQLQINVWESEESDEVNVEANKRLRKSISVIILVFSPSLTILAKVELSTEEIIYKAEGSKKTGSPFILYCEFLHDPWNQNIENSLSWGGQLVKYNLGWCKY